MGSCSSVDSVPAWCLGGHGFGFCWRLTFSLSHAHLLQRSSFLSGVIYLLSEWKLKQRELGGNSFRGGQKFSDGPHYYIFCGGGEGVGQLNKILPSKSRQEKFIYSKPKVKLHKLKVKKILQNFDKK